MSQQDSMTKVHQYSTSPWVFFSGLRRICWALTGMFFVVFLSSLLPPATRKLPWFLEYSLYFVLGALTLAMVSGLLSSMCKKPSMNDKFE